MKDLRLDSLHLQNFKGIRELYLEFNEITNILGGNGTGKTTISDAFRWLCFDKDSADRKDFEIKTLSNGAPIHGLEHSVTGVMSINGKKTTLQKIFKEKWTKPRGKAEQELTGHTTEYLINEQKVSMSEFKKKVDSIIEEPLFKMITDPMYFNRDIKWQERRRVLMAIIGDVKDEQVINYNPELEPLRALLADTDIEALRKILSTRKKGYNQDTQMIPVRIDECNKSIQEMDFKAIRKSLEEKEFEVDELEKELTGLSLQDKERTEKSKRVMDLTIKMNRLEREAEMKKFQKARELDDKIFLLNSEIKRYERVKEEDTTSLEKSIEALEKEIKAKREEWTKEQGEILDFSNEHDFTCPTCRQLLPAQGIENKKQEMLDNFNSKKAKVLKRINEEGLELKKRKMSVETRLENLRAEKEKATEIIAQKEKEIGEVQKEKERDEKEPAKLPDEYFSLNNEIKALEKDTEEASEGSKDLLERKLQRKKDLQKEIDGLKTELRQEETNKNMQKRIEDLSKQERDLAAKIAKTEGEEFLAELFVKTKVEMLEGSINKRFSSVRFKLFNTLINGGIEDCCEALIDGVPFSDANHAAKINAGLDIINSLCEYYGVTAPIFIDGRESVNEIIHTQSQIINLIVSYDKELKVA
ncbi:MAG TPA: AAA family ATPase [Ignavibacteriales bacterium]|nr:AAA family ATPase [Ignavibacteriales bacterium]